MEKVQLFNDHFQNFKVYGIPKAQLIIADPPYNLGKNAYASNPVWYKDGDNKNGESELAGTEFFDTDKDFRPDLYLYWPQIRIARKRMYAIENLIEWRDMIDMLRRIGKDDRSPKYICPANLHEAHNAILEQVRRQDEIARERWQREYEERQRISSERKMKDAIKEEEDFIKRRKKYFGIRITSEYGFTIVVLKNIKDFKHEGDMLHHCVFHNAYYRKADSLILSARDSDNNPIETIEVDLHTFDIKQCYGDHDKFTPMHDNIIKTMTENMWQLKQVVNAS